MNPKFLEINNILALHEDLVRIHGGLSGIARPELLDSALNSPLNLWRYGNPKPDLYDLATAYAYSIVRNHPFLDGNKRTAFATMRTFLSLNRVRFYAPPKEAEDAIVNLAAGEVNDEAFASFLRVNSTLKPNPPLNLPRFFK